MKANSCVEKVFTAFFPIVIDRNYNGWFSGVVYIKDLPTSEDLRLDNYDKVYTALSEKGLWYRDTEPEIISIPDDSCTWKEVQEKVSRHFADSPLNYFTLAESEKILIYTAQIEVKDSQYSEDSDWAAFLNIAREVKCLKPAVDQISVISVDSTGNFLNSHDFSMDQYDELFDNSPTN